jgi:catalase
MAFINPKGRANYEPNSWGPEIGGGRESPAIGYKPAAEQITGDKLQAKGEKFADHYSQARQFFISQTPVEQTHIKDAFVFELSKVETPAIRARMVSHLLNVDKGLAKSVADGLGLAELPTPATPARAVIKDLPPSAALSIIANGPKAFAGRKLGILVTDGTDAKLLAALQNAVEATGGVHELIAPKVEGITCSKNMPLLIKQKINGGPSVLYDAVAVIPSAAGAALLANEATAKDFVNDAFAHAKFIAYSADALPLFEKANLAADMDAGFIQLTAPADAAAFVATCGALRFWDREALVHAV